MTGPGGQDATSRADDSGPGTAPIAEHSARHAVADDQTSPGAVRAALAEARQVLPLASPVLDVGAGGGANVRDLTGSGHAVIAVDISVDALRRAGLQGRSVAADVARLPFRDGAFPSAVCTEVLEHVAEPGAVFAEVSRALAEHGRLYVTVPNYANLAGLHKVLADRRSGRHDWNPWGAHVGGYEALMTGRRLWRSARPWFDLDRVRALDYGQALTGRFRPLDRLATGRAGQAVLRRLLPRLHRPGLPVLAWHGMHTELVLARRAR
jgi:SAM-dependent methyltransferase